ncbi:MAG: hypothetical protein F4X24_09900 [Rhodobacteraceae bacterium]|nr:hypothetical protein [Paracoccaceae bacterium]
MANLILNCIFHATGMIPACCIPSLNRSYRAFPGLLLAEFRQGRGNRIATGSNSPAQEFLQKPCFEHYPLPSVETAIELVVDFNLHHLDLPAGLNQERWT